MRCNTARTLFTKRIREPLGSHAELALGRHLQECRGCRDEANAFERQHAGMQRILAAVPAGEFPAVNVDTAAIFRPKPVTRSPRNRHFLIAGSVVLAVSIVLWMARAVPQSHDNRATSQNALAQDSGGEKSRGLPAVVKTDGEGVAIRNRTRTVGQMATGEKTRHKDGARDQRRHVALLGANSPSQITPDSAAPSPQPPLEMTLQSARDEVVRNTAHRVGDSNHADNILPVVFSPPVKLAAETGRVDRLFEGDKALSVSLTLDEKDQPLGVLLPRLGRVLKTRLSASGNVTDDKVSIHLKRPASEALTLLGRHLGFRWHRISGGYELTQDLSGRQREETLYRNELAPIETQLNLASRLLHLPPKDLRVRLDTLLEREKNESLTPQQRAELKAEKQISTDCLVSAPAVEASLTLFRALTPAQLDALLGGSELTYSTATGTLAPMLAERIYESAKNLEGIYGPQAKLQADATIRITDVMDQDELPPSRRNRQLRLECQFNMIRGEPKDPHYWGTRWAPAIPDAGEAGMDTNSQDPADPDLQQSVELALPGPSRSPALWQGGSIIGAAALGYVWTRQATLADVSEAIHRATGLEVISDSFVSARIDPTLLRAKQPLHQILSTLAKELDYQWEKKGRLILLRNRRFYRDRPAEVSRRVLGPFRNRAIGEKRLTLDAVSELLATLTDPQVRSLFRFWGWYLEDTGILPIESLFARRAHFRFWAGLGAAQKAAARSGTPLAVAQMLPKQKSLWTAAVFSPPVSSRTPSPEFRTPTSEELAGGTFALRSYEVQLMSFIRYVDEGKRLVGNSISVEGPRSVNPLNYISDENGNKPEGAGPQISADGYQFQYFLGGRREPAVKDQIMLAPPLERKDLPK